MEEMKYKFKMKYKFITMTISFKDHVCSPPLHMTLTVMKMALFMAETASICTGDLVLTNSFYS